MHIVELRELPELSMMLQFRNKDMLGPVGKGLGTLLLVLGFMLGPQGSAFTQPNGTVTLSPHQRGIRVSQCRERVGRLGVLQGVPDPNRMQIMNKKKTV